MARRRWRVGRIYERAGSFDRAEACYRRAATPTRVEVRSESLYRLGLRCRRERRFSEAAAIWRELVALTELGRRAADAAAAALRQFAVEALAIHHEHRERDLRAARELALFALKEVEERGRDDRRADGYRHRLARLESESCAEKENAQLFWS